MISFSNISDNLVKKYNIGSIKKITRLEGGFRNRCFKIDSNKGKYIFIIYKNEYGVKKAILNAHFVARLLKLKRFKTRVPILAINGSEVVKINFQEGYHYCALYNYLEGKTIPWEAYTRRHLKAIGKTLSDIHWHLLLKGNKLIRFNMLSVGKNFQNWQDVTKMEIRQMRSYLKNVEPWIQKKLKVKLAWEKIENIFLKLARNRCLDKGFLSVIHYDFLRGNILFSNKLDKKNDLYPIVGILDFEKVCIGPVIADIARTLAFLLIDVKYKQDKEIRKRFLLSGYEKRGKSDLPFSNIYDYNLEVLLKYFWLRDFWKFLENNPYESLHLNEHYLRTRDKLSETGILIA